MRTSILAGVAAASLAVVATGCGSSTSAPDAGEDASSTSSSHTTSSSTSSSKTSSTSSVSSSSSSVQSSSVTSSSTSEDAGGSTSSGSGDAGSSSSSSSSSSSGPAACTTVATGQLRGSAIALTPDDSRLVVVNRDVGTVTVMSIVIDAGNEPVLTKVAELAVGSGTGSLPWQVVVDGCGENAYVVLRNDQKVVAINNLNTTPTVGASVSVGSEPTSLALTPHNSALYVSNWVDGSLSVINPATMTLTSTVDLNAALVGTTAAGAPVLGTVTPRAGLAHPRGIAITNSGAATDAGETVYATEWFAARTGAESLTPAASPTVAPFSDINWEGLLYKVPVSTGTATTIALPPVLATNFLDANGNQTGCFPNQVGSVTLDGNGFAYVTSTCASPAGPTGVFQKGQCSIDAECTAAVGSTAGGAAGSCVNGACIDVCVTGTAAGDATCGVGSATGACGANGACAPLALNAKTTTHPAVSIVTLSTGAATTKSLDTLFTTSADITLVSGTGGALGGAASTRMPLLPVDIDFKGSFAYVASEGADALFRMTTNTGAITAVGSSTNAFIDTKTSADQSIHLPIGLAITQSATQAFAYVANDGDRSVEVIDLNIQAVAHETATDFRVLASSAAPTGAALSVQHGKEEFVTGLGRWSLSGAAWGSCAACHFDGLSDNVTWYFARGPRQSVSLDGTFNKNDSTDQRILNWSGIFDEVADFETNVRGISGGVGAIVSVANAPCTVATQATDCASAVCNPNNLQCTPSTKERVNLFGTTPNNQGLEGSSATLAAASIMVDGVSGPLTAWADIKNYVAQIRSPRGVSAAASNATNIAAGAALFASGGCVGCHSGPKWTISKLFYTPGATPNDAFPGTAATSLSETSWAANLNGFPTGLFPSFPTNPPGFQYLGAGKQDMRSGAPPTFEQLQCALRPVGTILPNATNGSAPMGVSPAAVGVLELRQDMKTGAQGAGNANLTATGGFQGLATGADFTQGYNVPSLLGLQVGAPYFHAGNARTLEEVLSTTFQGHFQTAVASVFSPTPTQVEQLVAFMLSIDESTAASTVPAVGAAGGVICHYP